eukprot:SAG31_NODE_33877_length_339_cov_0.683333_1_plen_68_part_01
MCRKASVLPAINVLIVLSDVAIMCGGGQVRQDSNKGSDGVDQVNLQVSLEDLYSGASVHAAAMGPCHL